MLPMNGMTSTTSLLHSLIVLSTHYAKHKRNTTVSMELTVYWKKQIPNKCRVIDKNYKYCLPKNGMKEPKIEGRKPSQEGTIVQVRDNKDLHNGRGMEKSRF